MVTYASAHSPSHPHAENRSPNDDDYTQWSPPPFGPDARRAGVVLWCRMLSFSSTCTVVTLASALQVGSGGGLHGRAPCPIAPLLS